MKFRSLSAQVLLSTRVFQLQMDSLRKLKKTIIIVIPVWLRIKPDKHEALHNWGAALVDEAQELSGDARARKFKEAGEKYAEALRIKPDNHDALNNWGIALADEALVLSGDARAQKLEEAVSACKRAKQITGLGNYNLACVYSLSGELEKALDELEICHADNTLPGKSHLIEDEDMNPIRADARFLKILDSVV